MKRSRFFLMSLGVVALLIFAAHAMWSVVRADLPESTATQIYEPSFDEWAFVYLRASYRDSGSETNYVNVDRESINGKVRYKVTGRYAKTPQGQAWYDRVGSKIRTAIADDCKRWTAEGYGISLKDFEIDISPQADEKPR